MKRKPRYDKKETLGKRMVRNCWRTNDFKTLDIAIGEVYDLNKKRLEKCQDRMKKLDELHSEFISDPRGFIEKYAKMDKNQTALDILKNNPNLLKNEDLSA